MTRLRIVLFFVGIFVFTLISVNTAFSQCSCWLDGIEAELVPNSVGTICEMRENGLVVVSLAAPEDFCDNQVILGASRGMCSKGNIPGDPDPPGGINCGPGFQEAAPDEEGVCEQDIEDFCESLQTRPIPTLSEWGLIAMASLFGLLGFFFVRRKAIAKEL